MRIVLYHAECVDGFAAAAVLYREFGESASYIPVWYNEPPPPLEYEGHELYVVDFCYPPEVLAQLAKRTQLLSIYDHHPTGINWVKAFHGSGDDPGNVWTCLSQSRSGAGIVADHYGKRTWVESYVEDRDLWRFSLPNSKEITAFLGTQTGSFLEWCDLHAMKPEQAAELGRGALAAQQAYAKAVAATAESVVFAGYPDIPVINLAKPINSEVLGLLAESALFSVGYFIRGRKAHYSLRSRGSFNVRELAELFGGGGHDRAAGFVIPADHPLPR